MKIENLYVIYRQTTKLIQLILIYKVRKKKQLIQILNLFKFKIWTFCATYEYEIKLSIFFSLIEEKEKTICAKAQYKHGRNKSTKDSVAINCVKCKLKKKLTKNQQKQKLNVSNCEIYL